MSMNFWRLDEDDDTERRSEGSEFVSIVVQYPGAKCRHLTPHHIKRNENNEPITIQTGSHSRIITYIGDEHSVKSKKVEKWVTEKKELM